MLWFLQVQYRFSGEMLVFYKFSTGSMARVLVFDSQHRFSGEVLVVYMFNASSVVSFSTGSVQVLW